MSAVLTVRGSLPADPKKARWARRPLSVPARSPSGHSNQSITISGNLSATARIFSQMANATGAILMRSTIVIAALAALAAFAATAQSEWRDPSPHTVRFVTVAPDVRLEVLDWGGTGRAIVLLAGLGNTAHVFDDFATKLTGQYHVYGVTRRGFGASSVPASGYDSDRLGDDVVAVLDELKLDRPVLVGHSIAGTELSSIATRRPERVAGVVYLDAAYGYAFDNGRGASIEQMTKATAGVNSPPPGPADVVSFETVRAWYLRSSGIVLPEAEFRATETTLADGKPGPPRESPGSAAIIAGVRKYVAIRTPALAIFALPHDHGPWAANADTKVREAFAQTDALVALQAKAFEEGVPGSRAVRLEHANHYVFLSNEADVLRELRTFIAGLPLDAARRGARVGGALHGPAANLSVVAGVPTRDAKNG
jgi:pimeloyl-ACP methyl ester carboxylesterase